MEVSGSETMEMDTGTEMSAVDEILAGLTSHHKLDRDKGILRLNSLLSSWGDELDERMMAELRVLQFRLLENLGFEQEGVIIPWEVKHGCLTAAYPLILKLERKKEEMDFLRKIQAMALKLLRDDDYRVQLVAGGVLGFLSKSLGPSVYENSRETLMELISKYLQETTHEDLISPEQGFDITSSSFLIKEKVQREALEWSRLEPSLKSLEFMIQNLESDFALLMDQGLVNIIMSTLNHPNRHVRETGFNICTALIQSAPENVLEFGHQLSVKLSAGLSDHWNQVRIAALITTRRFLTSFKNSSEQFFPRLLPRLCLNRYYSAEGVRIYAQDTWRIVVGLEGKLFVGKYISNVVEFYKEACESSNPAERESACSCISELAQKIEGAKPYVGQLIQTLITCSSDKCWSVRDAACLALGNFAMPYPAELQQHLDTIYPILFQNLEDPMPLLRQGAAASLANLVEVYEEEAKTIVLNKLNSVNIEERLGLVTAQLCATCQDSTTPGAADDTTTSAVHVSELPGHPVSSSCCPACSRQAWHLVDGCLYLIGSLAEKKNFSSELTPLLHFVLTASQRRENKEHFTVLETVCKITPLLAKGIGKPFKNHLDQFFEVIFFAVESQSPVTSGAGKNCLSLLSQLIGPNIFKSRVQIYDPRYLHYLDDLGQPPLHSGLKHAS